MAKKIKSNLKVMLVNPYSKRYPWELKRTGQPLALLVLATYLNKVLGIETSILDATAEGFQNEILGANGRILYGLTPNEFQKRISIECPDIVLFSIQFTCQYTSLIECTKLVKEVNENILICVGGIHTVALPEEVLANASVDFVFLGEENTLDDFFLALLGKKDFSNIKAFGYKKKGSILLNKEKQYIKDLSQIPIYDIKWLNEDLYNNSVFHNGVTNKKFFDIITERGCQFNCNFCATATVSRTAPFRRHTLEQLENLFISLKEKGYELILNEDDNGFFDNERITRLMRLYKKYGLTWQQVHGIGPNQVDRDLIDLMKETGCEKIYLAIESCDEAFRLNELGKPAIVSSFENQELLNKIEMLNNAGIKVDVGFIIGHPKQTLEDIRKEIIFAKIIKQAGTNFVMPWILTLLPGTPFWNLLKDNRVGNYDDCNVMTGNIACKNFNPEMLRRIQQDAIEYINEISFKEDFISRGWDSATVTQNVDSERS